MSRWEKLERKPAPLFAEKFGPLTGIRVLLNGTVVAAPFSSTMMSDFGAEVIQLERPSQGGDTARHQNPQVGDAEKHISGAWMQNARNRLSFTLETNLKKVPASKDIFYSLIKQSDVWIENMVWINKLGITEEELFEINPRLVICHVSGFGTPRFGGDPYTLNLPLYDPNAQAESGWNYLQGFPDKPPYFAQQYIGDYLSGLFAFAGIMMALRHVEKTGKGQVVDATLVESYMRVMDDNFVLWDQMKFQKERQGVKQKAYQPARLFQTKDNKWINLGCYGKGPYEKVLRGFDLDPEEYPYEKYGLGEENVNAPHGLELDAKFDKFFKDHTAQEGFEILAEKGLVANIVKNCEEVMNEVHWQKRGDWVHYQDQTTGREVTAYGFSPKLSETPGKVWRGAPALGQDTERIMRELLDYSQEEIDALKGQGVID